MIDGIKQLGSLSLTRGASGVSSLTESLFGGEQQSTPAQQTGASFASVLGNVSMDAMNNLKKAEVASFEGIQGKANTREVVDAVLSAEQSLQTAIALRDKIVSAYLDITKMQI
ncbi:flagellar hook-basal body protein FliE [Agrobacterium tumefaciens]|jgi:flagellar hook-basal body complex protein FliE|uniref:Flagellar hook-basal body complex protein FliE n=1 Tax=Agrobacterium fabrum (strain C58 / ATCC 33970) TaxID=176299 RepID=FLIE_AGRFC|nr:MULTISPECIES: flagellar hook-basal body complex protein FliE [Agrobacterium]Q44337.1 RecName: Full=Flagellar hook-basal body complex protein FliE [Agrobacterium fabrum str. C58]AAB68967.1 FliE [Agrobacterium tumefaciens]AAB71789.1 FliE [Agrobacterium tumefaciens]AAK86365.1 flagellar hook-basal body complex protein [Agrobacterium fabrum str. C58]EGL64497.1 flagellar hook-basal body protein [Agrobacterium sp. ATCC 31749]KEY54961.1 flagellar hook-basal body protein FliE [Agrobacterium tumefac